MSLYLGTSQGERDISDQIGHAGRRVTGRGFQGQLKHVFPQWTEIPCYLRLEASSGEDPTTGEDPFLCITNPIWIVTE
jgi:hypothetical protein